MKKLLFTISLLSISTLIHARGNFEFTYSGTGGTASYNPSAPSPLAGSGPRILYTASGQPYLSGGRAVTLPGSPNPVTLALKSPITKLGAAAAVGALARLSTPVGAALTILSLIDLVDNELPNLQKTADGWQTLGGIETYWYTRNQFFPTAEAACQAEFSLPNYVNPTFTFEGVKPNRRILCKAFFNSPEASPIQTYIYEYGKAVIPPKTLTHQELVDAIARQAGWPSTQTLQDALNHPDIDFDAETKPSVTGPLINPGVPQTQTVSNPDGSTTTTTRTPVTNIGYSGPTVSTITTIVTTITNNYPDGSTTTTTETAETAPLPPPEQKQLCELFPDILACKKLEPPTDSPIPRATRDITPQAGPTFSGGSCPPDVVVNVSGRQITVLRTSQPCGWIQTYLRPIILLLAAISAAFIVLPRAD
jgi:Neisseria meningitidis TspB protein